MLHTTIELKPDYSKAGISHSEGVAKLVTYIIDTPDMVAVKKRPMVLICPGGGYGHLSPREAEPIALRMNAHGYNACVLYYSLVPDQYPCQLIEAAMAVDCIKKHAEEWHVMLDKLCICGFSAGAHVAGSLGTMWKDEVITKVLGGNSEDYKPSSMLLCYPVITAGEYAHRGSFDNLVGGDESLYDTVSLEKRVNADTIPTFIWHTFEDGAVPVENSLLMAAALRKYRIPCELHIFQKGNHGLALATRETACESLKEIEPECACWPELFATWFNQN